MATNDCDLLGGECGSIFSFGIVRLLGSKHNRHTFDQENTTHIDRKQKKIVEQIQVLIQWDKWWNKQNVFLNLCSKSIE